MNVSTNRGKTARARKPITDTGPKREASGILPWWPEQGAKAAEGSFDPARALLRQVNGGMTPHKVVQHRLRLV